LGSADGLVQEPAPVNPPDDTMDKNTPQEVIDAQFIELITPTPEKTRLENLLSYLHVALEMNLIDPDEAIERLHAVGVSYTEAAQVLADLGDLEVVYIPATDVEK
jgi:hypothetical protein